jgi:hypothetical protein
MEQQHFNPAFQQQTFNPNLSRPEGCYQVSPFGVVLQPVSMRPQPNTTLPISSPHMSIASPQSVQTSKPGPTILSNPISILSPLSVGGFLYTQPPYLQPTQAPPLSPFILSQTPQTNSKPYVSSEIAARQEKLEKYREKRAKRNYNRPVDQGKSDRACARTRDTHGQFASESKREQEKMRQALEASQWESMLLKSKMKAIEQELAEVRRRAEEEQATKQALQKQLEAQTHMNQELLRENSLLWSTVPSDEVFNTTNQNNPPVFLDAFKQKIDFSTIELNWTDSRHLEAARLEDMDFEQRWDEMTFFAGARS